MKKLFIDKHGKLRLVTILILWILVVAMLVTIVGTLVLIVTKDRFEKEKCQSYGYPKMIRLMSREIYCVKLDNGRDVIVPLWCLDRFNSQYTGKPDGQN